MSRSIALVAALASTAAAHGYMRTVILDGTEFEGFNRWNPNPDPNAIGWTFSTENEGPELDLSSPDFVCRSDSTPASNYGPIAAGGTASFLWTSDDLERNPNGWAHQGPIMTYIAPCPNNDCESVDKTALLWTKIGEIGVISGQANSGGVWATDAMRDNGGLSDAVIPASIAPGNYVIRHELIALHRAHINEPEFYPQCANIEVTGSGTDDLSGKGTLAANLYSTSDSQLFGFSIHDNRGSEWPMPGPALYTASSGGSSESEPPVVEETPEEPEETPEEIPEEEEEEETPGTGRPGRPGRPEQDGGCNFFGPDGRQ